MKRHQRGTPVVELSGEGLRPIESDEDRRRLDAAMEKARRRGQAAVAEILERPEMLTGEEFAARAGVSRGTVDMWRRDRRILGLEGSARGVRYPAWQFDDNGVLVKDLSKFLRAVNDDWAAYRWLTSELPEIGGEVGLDLLRKGRTDELIDAAQHFGETF